METHLAAPATGRAFAVPVPVGLLGDERLAQLVGQGNERAFTTLYSRYHQQLYRYCQSIVRHEADAQDALQSTFTAALTALRRGQRNAPLRPWLYRIAHNESISQLRRRPAADELPETLSDSAQSAEVTAEERARLAALVADLQALPERQRGALVMRELSGLSHEELAQALGVSVGAAKQTVFEARQALQEFAEGRAMACEEIQRIVSDGDRRALRGRRLRAHLRDCSRCHAFAEAIPERRAALLALSPALPAAAAAGLLQQITGATHHSAGGSGLLAGAGGKGLGLALSTKSLATGIAVVATAGAVGTVEVVSHSGHSSASTHALRHAHHGSGAGGSAVAGSRSAGGHRAGASRIGSRTAGAQGGALAHTRHAAHGSQGRRHANSSSSSNPSATNPNAHGGNPNAHGGNPNAHGGNPNAHGGNPNARGGNSNAHGGNSNAHGTNPNARGGNTNAGGSRSTTSHGTNPNARGGNTNAGGGQSTTSHGTNPNASGGGTKAKGRHHK